MAGCPVDRRALALRIALAWLLVAGISLIASFDQLSSQSIRGDDALRLVQVRDLIAGQGWFDLRQYRISPPEGVPMHWSRLVDLPILAVIALLAPVLGQAGAELAAQIIVPLGVLALTMAAVGWSAARLFDLRTAGLAAIAVGLLPAVLSQMQPGVLDHHGWQVAMVVLAAAGFVAGAGWRGPVLAGAAMAVGTSISLEVMTMAAAFGLVFALCWLADRRSRAQLALYLASFASGLALIFLIALGPANFVQYCDAIGPAHLLLFGVIAAAVAVVARLDPARPFFIMAPLALAGALGVASFAMAAPQCLASPFGTLAPDVRTYWYALVMEGRPIWEQNFALAAPVLVQLIVGLGAALYLARSRGGIWPLYTFLIVLALGFGMLTWRSLAFAGALAALPLGWLIASAFTRVEREKAVWAKGAILGALVLALMPSLVFDRLIPADRTGPGAGTALPSGADNCYAPENFTRISGLAHGTIAMPFDMGPAMLAHTPHSVLATGHHRAEQAMADTLAIFRSDPATAYAIVARREVDYIALCKGMSDTQVYARSAPEGLAANLLRDRAPAWLIPVPRLDEGNLRVWRVR
jgi:hypothetical protein